MRGEHRADAARGKRRQLRGTDLACCVRLMGSCACALAERAACSAALASRRCHPGRSLSLRVRFCRARRRPDRVLADSLAHDSDSGSPGGFQSRILAGLWAPNSGSGALMMAATLRCSLCRTSRRHRLPVGGYEAVSNASCVCARYLGPHQGHQDVGPHGRDAGRPRGGLAGGLCSGLRLHKRRPVPVLTLQRPTVLLVFFLLRQRQMARILCKLHTDPRSTAHNTDPLFSLFVMRACCACMPQLRQADCVLC